MLTEEQKYEACFRDGGNEIDNSRFKIIIEFCENIYEKLVNFSRDPNDAPIYDLTRVKNILNGVYGRVVFRSENDGSYKYETELGLTREKAIDILKSLTKNEFFRTFDEDDKYDDADVYFKVIDLNGIKTSIFIKLRLEHKKKLYVISFHKAYF